jgi:uncharacterized protein YeaO (DUF488 family)
VLVCRYRPRALRREHETWDEWRKELGPSRELHAAYYGKNGPPIGLDAYVPRYLEEMKGAEPREAIAQLADRAAAGETVTLLCSSACTDASKCHRTLLAELLEAELRARGSR